MLCYVFSVIIQSAEAKNVTLRFWHSLAADGLFEELTQEFTRQNPDIAIIITNYPTEDLKTTLIFSSLKNDAPDVVLFPSDLLGYYGVFKLGEIPEKWFSKNLDKKFIQTTGADNKTYGIPVYTGNHLMLFYNKSLIDTPATTWTEMSKQLPMIAAKGAMPLALRINKMYWFISFLNAYGGYPIVDDRIVINRLAMVKALQAYKGLLDMQLTESNCDFECTNGRFFKGDFAYSFNGIWSLNDGKKHLGNNFAVAPLPTIDGLPLKPMRSTSVLAFPNNSLISEKSSALLTFSIYMQSVSVQKKLYEKMGVIPVDINLAKEISQHSNANKKAVMAQLDNTIDMSASPAMAALWPGMAKGVELYLANELTDKQAVDFIEKQISHELGKINRLKAMSSNE